jgi:hypothetical protein
MKKIFLFLSLLIINLFAAANCSFSIAAVRYVSHSGSNTPPYLTWETAADSIMSAINISSFGDTIYVANGVYEEQVVMIPGLSLVGAGMDSCVIDTRNFTAPQAVKVKDSCLFKNFKIIVQNSTQSNGNGIIISGINSLIEYNEILNGCSPALWCDDTNSIIKHNRIINAYWGIYIEFNQPIIDSNYIYISAAAGKGINPTLGSDPIIRGNIIVINNSNNTTVGYWAGFNNGATLYNNEFYSINSDNAVAAYSVEIIINNVVYGNYNYGIYKYPGGIIKNNVVSGGDVGIRVYGSPSPDIKYNDVWNNQINYVNHTPDSTNVSFDPMFVNTDSMDFHLQKYSPLIDAGDPSILDKDSTRSDIGVFGGPYGESYSYPDIPPRAPVNLSALTDSGVIVIKWNRNTEADFNHYNLFRDTTANFAADSTTFAASVEDTFYLQVTPIGITDLYFKLTAVDNQGNESEPSEELHIVLTGTNEDEKLTINNYQLYQNYPNPFNPSTKISYRLKERGYIKLYVYDIKGELVETLVNKYQEGGYYEVKFSPSGPGNPESGKLASGIYIYQIMVRNEQNIPVFTDIKKMIYLK